MTQSAKAFVVLLLRMVAKLCYKVAPVLQDTYREQVVLYLGVGYAC